jgi:hypothetical protein
LPEADEFGLAAQSYVTTTNARDDVMNDYAHMQLHQAALRETARDARRQRPARRRRLTMLSRHTPERIAVPAGRPSQVRPA